jgi:hypothetical protein
MFSPRFCPSWIPPPSRPTPGYPGHCNSLPSSSKPVSRIMFYQYSLAASICILRFEFWSILINLNLNARDLTGLVFILRLEVPMGLPCPRV